MNLSDFTPDTGDSTSESNFSSPYQKLPFLSSDVWDHILSYLPSEVHAYKVRCLNYEPMLRACQRRTTVSYHTELNIPSIWPTSLKSLTSVLDLDVSCFDVNEWSSYLPLHGLEPANIPRTLTRLALDMNRSTAPFCVIDASKGPDRIALLDGLLPNLAYLKCNQFNFFGSQFWTIPSSVTDLSTKGALFSPDIPLPKGLRHFRAFGMDVDASLFTDTIAQHIETIQTDRFSCGPHLMLLPSLTSLSIDPSYCPEWKDCIHTVCPRLKHLTLHSWMTDFSIKKCSHLASFHSDWSTKVNNLPASITLWTCQEAFNSRHLCPIEAEVFENVLHLPPSFTALSLYSPPLRALNGITHLLPIGLTQLDARDLVLEPSEFKFLPTTLQCLHIFNINPKNVMHLARLTHLRDLGWYGGILRKKVVQSLPKNLDALTLGSVALITKGAYKAPGTSEYSRYSATNPQLTALAALPHVRKFVLLPNRRHHYYATHTYEIMQSLPSSIETLVLNLQDHPISLFPFSPSFDVNSISLSEDAASDIFHRFKALTHLYINCQRVMGVVSLGGSQLILAVPNGVKILHLPLFAWSQHYGDQLPLLADSVIVTNANLRVARIARSANAPALRSFYASYREAYRGPDQILHPPVFGRY